MLFYNSNIETEEKSMWKSSCFRSESNTQNTDKGAAIKKIRNHTYKLKRIRRWRASHKKTPKYRRKASKYSLITTQNLCPLLVSTKRNGRSVINLAASDVPTACPSIYTSGKQNLCLLRVTFPCPNTDNPKSSQQFVIIKNKM